MERPSVELTPRQREVLRLIERGHTNSEIAERLGISLQGAKWHVRELLGKYGVQSREELAVARAADRGVAARVGRWMSGLASIGVPKVSLAPALSVTAGAVVSGVAVAALLVGTGDGRVPPEGQEPIALKAAATATALPPLVASKNPPAGAKWTPQEAFDHARQETGADIALKYDTSLTQPIDLDQFTVTKFEWLPQTSSFELPDGDTYWDNQDGQPHDLWRVQWQAKGLLTKPNYDFQYADVTVDALIEDGVTTKGLKAVRVAGVETGGSGSSKLGGASGFESRQQMAQFRAMVEPVGPSYEVARQNGDPNAPALEVFANAAGSWCYKWPQLGMGCGFNPANPMATVSFGVGSSSPTASIPGRTDLTVTTDRSVARIRVLPGDGRQIDLDLSDPPDGVPAGSRFAYFELGPSVPADKITVIGYDANGTEVARKTRPGL
jgi:DNA-binding CsgD family transcriptional regulator